MDPYPIRLLYDEGGDVLYVVRHGQNPCASSYPAPEDDYLIITVDGAGAVVGFTLLAARELSPAEWAAHPARPALPGDLLGCADSWYAERGVP